jgi:hypothetical protein
VAEHDQSPLCARERDVDSPGVGEEAEAAVLGCAHATEDDHLLFTALEAVDRRDLDRCWVTTAAAAAAAAAAQPGAQQPHLRGIGAHDANIGGAQPSGAQPQHDGSRRLDLGAVDLGQAIARLAATVDGQ